MKREFVKVIGVLALLGLTYSCVEPFSPPEVNDDQGYLVVDGFLNVGQDTSWIALSHTQNPNATEAMSMESRAKVVVEEEKGGTYPFTEKGNGSYFLPPKTFSQSAKYRLRVETAGGSIYLSDYVEVKTTPPIDHIEGKYDARQNGMAMQVNTHDATNNTRFYRWKFEETWEYRAAFFSAVEAITNEENQRELISRRQNINVCWRTIKSANILLGSTIKLSQDIIKDLPLTTVPVSSNKLYFKYSILVKQYGLTQDAFEYWTSLAKTTEGTGSLFDPLPSQITGNIKNTADPQELVFGYFSASVEQKKRIFLSPGLGAYPQCTAPDTLPLADALKASALLLNTVGIRFDSVLVTSDYCADCRVQGGVTTKPSFWE